ncbi:transmembrane protein 186 isoform X1 [Danio rerio]|nr:transmembrane protein 186 isoform X1 [Danio rerio]XP_005161825.1 transmembrane protein 186 isoform X1 [Danio rerio]|eukprot:XP_005161824.1 transmembrane protein 186 isoform X1 [Danio rerio]
MMMSTRLIHLSRHFPQYGFRCHPSGLISSARMQYNINNGLAHMGKQMPNTSTHTTRIHPASFSSDLASRKYSLIYAFPLIRGLRALSRLKLLQTGITVVLLPTVYYLHLQGQASVLVLNRSIGIALFAGVMLYSISHFVRRVVGMMYLDSTQTILKVSHLSFWGHRRDIYVPVSDVVTLGDSGDSRGESILRLKRYSTSNTMYFSTRLGRVVDRHAFGKVFGSLS